MTAGFWLVVGIFALIFALGVCLATEPKETDDE